MRVEMLRRNRVKRFRRVPQRSENPVPPSEKTMLFLVTLSTGLGALRAELVVLAVPLIARLLLGIFLKLAWIIVSIRAKLFYAVGIGILS